MLRCAQHDTRGVSTCHAERSAAESKHPIPRCLSCTKENCYMISNQARGAVSKALKSLPWLGTRRCSSSWTMTKSWKPTS